MNSRSRSVTVKAQAPPLELRKLEQWVCWKAEQVGARTKKVPTSPHTGRKASVTEPADWATYAKARRTCKRLGLDGVGVVFTKDDTYCGIDLDNCRDPNSGRIQPWAEEMVRSLDSYSELSPSGRGIHIIVRGKLPAGARNRTTYPPQSKSCVEIYDSARYFTVTGMVLEVSNDSRTSKTA